MVRPTKIPEEISEEFEKVKTWFWQTYAKKIEVNWDYNIDYQKFVGVVIFQDLGRWYRFPPVDLTLKMLSQPWFINRLVEEIFPYWKARLTMAMEGKKWEEPI